MSPLNKSHRKLQALKQPHPTHLCKAGQSGASHHQQWLMSQAGCNQDSASLRKAELNQVGLLAWQGERRVTWKLKGESTR